MSDDTPKAGFWHGVFAGFCGFIVVVQLAYTSSHACVAFATSRSD